MSELGHLYIVAAPSGGGKTSLIKALLADVVNIDVSISHTTRSKRPFEKEGRDYYFVDDGPFNEMVAADEFVEHATVFSHQYGTSKAELLGKLNEGIDVLLDIDWQGADQLTHLYQNVVTVFIVPPSLDVLRQRLTDRAGDHPEAVDKRMADAQSEISHFESFDYLIVNEVFEQALAELKAIVYANRLKRPIQQQRYKKLLSNLLETP